MNIFDIITIIVLGVGLFTGWRKGFTSQLCSLVGIVLGIGLAILFGEQVGNMLNLDPAYSKIIGFIITFIVAVIGTSFAARIISSLLSTIGLGFVDTILGILFSVFKYALILSVIYVALERFNQNTQVIDKQMFSQSKTFKPISAISGKTLDWFNAFSKEVNR